jgi:hypothetical protein
MKERWQSGYHGEDSLRDKAHRWAKAELMGAEGGEVPASMSAPQNTKMRPFKRGGHAKGGECAGGRMYSEGGEMHDMSHGQYKAYGGRLGYPDRAKRIPVKRGGRCKAEGGDIPKKGFGGSFLEKLKTQQQGPLTAFRNRSLSGPYGYVTDSDHVARGGRVPKRAMGGPMNNVNAPLAPSDPRNLEKFREAAKGLTRGYQPYSDVVYGGQHGYPKWKKGGHAGHSLEDDYEPHGKHHGLNHDQSDMHIPRRSRNSATRNVSHEKSERLARGGDMRLNVETRREYENEGKRMGGYERERHAYEAKHGKNKKGWGGLLGGLGGTYFGGPLGGMLGSAVGNMLPFKKGGPAHRRHHRANGGEIPRKAMGGMQGFNPAMQSDIPAQPQQLQPQMRRGGAMKHRKAEGGTIYEKQMVGERPGSKAHHFNYESEMKGERAVSKPSSRHQSKRGLHDMEHGQLFKRGGHKKAAGGVGKIRHEQATRSGMPRGSARVIRNDLF